VHITDLQTNNGSCMADVFYRRGIIGGNGCIPECKALSRDKREERQITQALETTSIKEKKPGVAKTTQT
jgi:hypothetical protein